MLFYSIVAVVIGCLFLIFGISHIFCKDKMSKLYKDKKFININKYLLFEGLTMLFCGVVLLISGLFSFIVEADLIFSLIFTFAILIFFTSDIVCRKKLVLSD